MVGQRVLDDLFEGLVTLGEDGQTVPGVALTWDTSADGKTWTFHLRKDARWSNGQPVTADDFVYAWRRQVDPATGSEYSQALAPIENAMDIAAGKMPVDQPWRRVGRTAARSSSICTRRRLICWRF